MRRHLGSTAGNGHVVRQDFAGFLEDVVDFDFLAGGLGNGVFFFRKLFKFIRRLQQGLAQGAAPLVFHGQALLFHLMHFALALFQVE